MARSTVLVPVLSFLAAALLPGASAAAQQHDTHPTGEIVLNGEIALFDNLGPHTRPITTTSPEAQAFFDQGLRLAYAFGRHESQQSFVAAARKDPRCASCRWGLAWALGPYANGAMDSGAEAIAYQQALEAKRLAGETQIRDVERALIDALTVRYALEPTASGRARHDTAYAGAMRDVVRRFPDDPDAAAMFAEAVMVLRTGNYWTRAGAPQPGMEEVLEVLEGALREDPGHPGACHLYIHATEGSPAPERATPCADLLVNAMPGASHMQHMPAHTYVRVGRYADAVRVSNLALAADRQAERGGAVAIYPDHNLHMLLLAASYDGQSEVAIRAARDLAEMSRASGHHLPLVLARFGQWEDLLRISGTTDDFQTGMLAYAQGLALLRLGRAADAEQLTDAIDNEIAAVRAPRDRRLLEIARAILAAEIAADAGNHDEAIRSLGGARAIEADSLGYAEPEDWIVPVRQVLGAILLDAGRAADAEAAYRGELEAHPENGWSLYGLHLALTAQGKNDEAAATLARFRRAWARADVGLRGSRF